MKPLMLPILASLMTLTSLVGAQASLTDLTTSPKLWQTSARDFSSQFADLDWEDGDKNYPRISNLKNLTLWGESIEAVMLGERGGVLRELKFVALGDDSSALMDKNEFNQRASKWKKLLDQRLGSKGKVMAPIFMAEIKHTRVAWKCENYIVVLSANIGTKPDSMVVSFFETKAGLANVKLKGQQDAEYLAKNSEKKSANEPSKESGADSDVAEVDANATEEEKEILSMIAKISAREPSKGVSDKVQDALNLLNVYRYLSGVSYDVKIDKGMTAAAADAVMICKKNGTISHDFGHSTDKCSLAMVSGDFTMKKSVFEYMRDSGAGNRANRGHRRSCLNHRMGKTGFAVDLPFSAMYVFDNSAKGSRKNYSYPGHGLYPIKYLHGSGWSYHLVSGDAPSECEVEVWRLNKREDKMPGWKKEPDGTKLPCAFVNTYADTIVFEPQADAITKKGYYLVRLKGRGLKEQYLVKLF